MPRTPPAPTPAAPRRGHPRLAMAIIVAGLGLIGLAMWAGYRNWQQNTVEGIATGLVAKFSAGLPKDYGNGLVLERITLEGRDIVMLVRSTRLTMAVAARDPASYAQVRTDEKQMMLRFCSYGDVRQVLARGLAIKRRFVDVHDKLFFEVTLTAQDCAPGANP